MEWQSYRFARSLETRQQDELEDADCKCYSMGAFAKGKRILRYASAYACGSPGSTKG
jgi:hypothetical protein